MLSKGLSKPHGRAVKAAGYRFEKHVENALNIAGIECERNGSRFGANDHGDIAAPAIDAAIQCKNTKTQALLRTMDAAWNQAIAAGAAHPIAVFRHRRGLDFGPHERNLWVFEERLALKLLELYHQHLTTTPETAPGDE